VAANPRTVALSRFEYLKIAGMAELDPRTVEGYFRRTKPTTRLAAKAIRRALKELGIPDPQPEARP
jgi:hypothetical protein